MKEIQEASVVDNSGGKAILTLVNQACGCVKQKEFYLAKGVTTYNQKLKIWGSAMLVAAPVDLHFEVL